MRIVGQDHNGRIIIDGEGETVHLTAQVPMPNSNAVVMTNFVFNGGGNSIDENNFNQAMAEIQMADIQEQLQQPMSDPSYSPATGLDHGFMSMPISIGAGKTNPCSEISLETEITDPIEDRFEILDL